MIPYSNWEPNYAGLLYLLAFGLVFGAIGIFLAIRENRRKRDSDGKR